MNPQPRTSHVLRSAIRAGFSLIELLVVISIIVILFTIALPSLRSLTGSGQASAAVNTFSAAVAAARSYAGLSPPFEFGSYSGCAIIVDTAGQLRLTLNAERFPDNYPAYGGVKSAGKYLVDEAGRILEIAHDDSEGPERHAANGYVDVAGREYLNLPRGTGILGIILGDSGLELLHPPFAIRFNAQGTFVASKGLDIYQNALSSSSNPQQRAWRVVCYDGDRNGEFFTGNSQGATRDNPFGGGTYRYDEWDPESDKYGPPNNMDARIHLPFEKLESVAGIVVYSKTDFADAGYESLSDDGIEENISSSNTKAQWIMEHGIKIFINRYTGSLNKVQ
ncbi:type II secretion system protein [Planctomycetales bacterium ZRK34]|nr:type II secretion system protein [Planctomycetales bacterium ZRK34]